MNAKTRVLLIEPDFVLANIYENQLSQLGCVVDLAYDAQSALHAADSHKPDLVVLELQLRGNSGVEFIHEFRSYPDWQKAPIILHTFTPPISLGLNRSQMELMGVAEYLYKPSTSLQVLGVSVQSLLETVRA